MASSYHNGRFDSRERFGGQSDNRRDHDKPPFSRVFIVCGKKHTSDDLRNCFQEYGTVEDIWVVKDKNTKENRGIAYIKFGKMSEACLAIERMNGERISEDDDGPKLKVIMAQPKSSKSNEDYEDESALTRLFVIIPKGMDEDELRDAFKDFGDIDYVQIVKDRKSGEKKGFGYIKYHRAYDAAKAVEDCDKAYKAVMAEPKSAKMKRDMAQESGSVGFGGGRQSSLGSQADWGFGSRGPSEHVGVTPQVPSFGFEDFGRGGISNRLQVQCSLHITAEQLARLFDIIPGMELCDLKRNFSTGESKGVAVVVYNSIGSATYAKEKLNGFEYPPGSSLSVRYAPDGENEFKSASHDIPSASMGGGGGGSGYGGEAPSSYCSVSLPPAKPLVSGDVNECAERLFVVCQPSPPPPNVLVDIFSRFGDLIDVFMLKNKNFGYAKYASADAAEKAIQTLHGAEVFNSRLKVLTAEPPKTAESARKRPRT